jgi:translation initiation factor IF-3
LIDEIGTQLGVFATDAALRMAREKGLDLVEVAPTARPPVCKLLDYGKLKYTKKKKSQEAKKKQSVVNVKEIQLRPRTEEHDFQTKLRHMSEFLKDGDKVKLTVLFRGREVAYTQQGIEMLHRIIEAVRDFGNPESYPKLEGKRMMMVLAPGKNTRPPMPAPVSRQQSAPIAPIAPATAAAPVVAAATTPIAPATATATPVAPAAAVTKPTAPVVKPVSGALKPKT